jgi:hypothetical protein
LKSLSELPELIEPESLEAIAKKLDSEFMGVADETQTKNQESD